jgi:hypothetical protein
MRDETDFARWGLIGLMVMVVALAAMKEWYRDRPGSDHAKLPDRGDTTSRRRRAASEVSPPVSSVPAAEPAKPHTRDLTEVPVIRLEDGRSLWFAQVIDDNIENWATTDRVFAWLWDDSKQDKTALPVPPSQRDHFSAILLEDGRLALIGGRTPRDVLALERTCDECADEYIAFGEAVGSRTTDIYDFDSRAWRSGPAAEFAGNVGNTAIQLRDGRILRVSVEQILLPTDVSEDLIVEIADPLLTRWKRAGAFHFRGHSTFADLNLVEREDGIDVRSPGAPDALLQWSSPDTLVLTHPLPAEASQ